MALIIIKSSLLFLVFAVSALSLEIILDEYPGLRLSPYLHEPFLHYRFLNPEYYSSSFRFNVRRLGLPPAGSTPTLHLPFTPVPLPSIPSYPLQPPFIFADSGETPRPQKTDVRNGFNRGPLEVVVNYSSVENSTRPAYSSLQYTVGCGVQNSLHPFKKILPDSDDGGRIIGGTDANPGEFPWQVSLQLKGKFGRQHICGGTIVSEDIVITASHCVHGTRPSDLQIIAGAHDLGAFSGSEQARGVRYILEKRYNDKTFERDIALLVLDNPLKFDRSRVAPVCLPDSGFTYNGVDGIITGWGRLSEAGKAAANLQVVPVPLVSAKKCSQSYQHVGYGNFVGKCHICSGSDEGGVDSCQGDSGGPLTCVESDGRHYLCGIVSWGIGCARPDFPGVYTFTPCYSKWIAEQVSAHNSTAF